MNSRLKSHVRFPWRLATVVFLLILLPILAVLQYRWIGEVSAAERQRLEGSLRIAASQFADDFGGEMTRLYNAFQFRNGFPRNGTLVIDRYRAWAETALYPHIVRGLYVLKTYSDKPPDLYKIGMDSADEEAIPLPAELSNLRDTSQPSPEGVPGTFPPIHNMLALTTFIRKLDLSTESTGSPPANPQTATSPATSQHPPRIEGWTIVELDRDIILKEVVPALVGRHFLARDEVDYRVALIEDDEKPQILYSSEGSWTPEDLATPDAAVNILGQPDSLSATPSDRFGNPPLVLRSEFIHNSIAGHRWLFLVKHRLGSLETAVGQVRRRNLAISFGILLVLGAGVVAVTISSQRARMLARLQMEFAASVSHELRTPLAVIRSAAHNLRTGIVHEKDGIERYAAIVDDEAGRLSDMVDQVLLYSETHSGRRKYKLAPVDVNEVIDRAVHNLAPAVDMEKCHLSMQIDPDLPPVQADVAALTQCVQNLLSNAFKYGKTGETANIEIAANIDDRAREVRLSVSDSGPGIDSTDQRYLFEPFYRGARGSSNVAGNGLGLHLVRRIMQEQGGRVTFNPSAQRGACFTLHIPASI